MNKNKIIEIFATWFGLGTSPKMPGTIGTIGAIPLYLSFLLIKDSRYYDNIYFIFLVLFFIFSIYISDEAEKIFGKKDAQSIVIDEVLGFLVTMFLITPSILNVFMGFILFRIFDIIKPYPIKKLQDIKGGTGVVIDDFCAGLMANLVLFIGGLLWI
ncbi:MAG: phosphatidylglycerophosphatase A [Fusobacteria bacterium]|jgi:phosphatidylglycerophosphatase A|nr:phosphatidylglycerophosphatase A [Fusobacteriota bacterium]